MKRYPKIFSEPETLSLALGGRSIGRFGDGEIRLAYGGRAASQDAHPKLRSELHQMLAGPTSCLTCLPNLYSDTPAMWFWEKYRSHKFIRDLTDKPYGSTWITRPDCAPWIDTDSFWDQLRDLWRGKDVILVTGDQKSLTTRLMNDAKSVRVVMSKRQHAYTEIDRIEEEIGHPSISVLLCLGATATVLAERLAKRGVHALDLGHVGMFMRRRQAVQSQLAVSDNVFRYLSLQVGDLAELTHDRTAWLKAYHQRLKATLTEINHSVAEFATVLDIGSGVGAIDVLLARQFGSRVTLIDGEDDPPHVKEQNRTFCHRNVVAEFMRQNEVTQEQYRYLSPKTLEPTPSDLIVSFHSWCFHYPPDFYLDFVLQCVKPGTRLILDVRKERPKWKAKLDDHFRWVKTVRSERKYDRMVFEYVP